MDRLYRFVRMHELENTETVIYDCSKLDQMKIKNPSTEMEYYYKFHTTSRN